MSEVEIPEGFVDTGFSPYSKRIGPILYNKVDNDDGTATGHVGIALDDSHIGGNNRGHGGILLTLLDEAMGMNAAIANDYHPVVTLSMQVNFIAATIPGNFLRATATVTHKTKSVAFVEGKAWCGDTLVGTANGVWKYLNVDYKMPKLEDVQQDAKK